MDTQADKIARDTARMVEEGDIHKAQDILDTKQDKEIPTLRKVEQTTECAKYLLLPQHNILIQYVGDVGAQLLKQLVKLKDVQSSVTVGDYPIITDVQRRLWYADTPVVERLCTVDVYKPVDTLSGWELRRKVEERTFRTGQKSVAKDLVKLAGNPFYKAVDEDKQKELRENLLHD